MRRDPSSSRRHLAVWFPFLPTDRLPPAPPEIPVVRVSKDRGALRLAAADAVALAQGLTPGMALADARARTPELIAVPHDPRGDAALLDRALVVFGRFSPMAALDEPHGLVLDITGCAHLFGGEAGLMQAARSLAKQMGLQARLAIGRTPQASRAMARFGPGGIIPEGEDRAVIRRLQVEALQLPPADTQAIRRAGLRTLGDLDDRPRAPLAARFGAGFPTRLDLILGLSDARITPARPPEPVVADRVLAEPILDTEPLETVLADLIGDVSARLEARLQSARVFRLTVFRVDGQARQVGVGTGRATRDVRAVQRLFRERLAALATPLDPGFGFDHLRLEAGRLQALTVEQHAFDDTPAADEALDALIDRLVARLGADAVVRIQPVASHIPERACRLRSATEARSGDSDWPKREPGPPDRPLQMFDPPQPVEVTALAPDGPPARFRWRRVMRKVTRAEGPERIEEEWWRRRERVRDYYRVEDEQGHRYWLFRAGHFGQEPPPRWYLHGLFA